MSGTITLTEECGMEITLSITSLIFSAPADDKELYFEGDGREGYVVLMTKDVKLRAKYYSTPEGYEIADISTGKMFTILDCLESFKDFASVVFSNNKFDCWD